MSPRVSVRCQIDVAGIENTEINGRLTYFLQNSTSPKSTVNDLAKLLTSGRFSLSSRELIEEVIQAEPNRTLGIIKAQQLVVLSPEFHIPILPESQAKVVQNRKRQRRQ